MKDGENMVEQQLKQLIISRYGSLKKFSEEQKIAWSTLDGVIKRGVNKANITSLIKICEGLEIDCESLYYGQIQPKQNFLLTSMLNEKEDEIIKKYRDLDDHGQTLISTVIALEHERCIKESASKYETVLKPFYAGSLSAGSGLYVFDDVESEQIEVPIDFRDIDFVISVNGDSMEPSYQTGDKVMLKKQHQINIGEIGAFIVNGEAYIKELGKNALISHNKKYAPIQFNDAMRIDCIGKVIGKL